MGRRWVPAEDEHARNSTSYEDYCLRAGEDARPKGQVLNRRQRLRDIGKEVETGGFAAITGSAKGEILINGAAPVPPPAAPEGRSLPTPLPGAAPPS